MRKLVSECTCTLIVTLKRGTTRMIHIDNAQKWVQLNRAAHYVYMWVFTLEAVNGQRWIRKWWRRSHYESDYELYYWPHVSNSKKTLAPNSTYSISKLAHLSSPGPVAPVEFFDLVALFSQFGWLCTILWRTFINPIVFNAAITCQLLQRDSSST